VGAFWQNAPDCDATHGDLTALRHGSSRGGAFTQPPRVVAAATEDNGKAQLLTTKKRRTSSAYRTLTHLVAAARGQWHGTIVNHQEASHVKRLPHTHASYLLAAELSSNT
jgi:hypothetical protein